jgi:hypothetical protein
LAERSFMFALVGERERSILRTGGWEFPRGPAASLHFIVTASKLTLLRWCKGNSLRCFLYGTL